VPRPDLLRGVYLVPDRIEAWRGSPDRLHDRRRFIREADGWREETLVP
jgi:pyridoxamine 5'-phosphate oxidase